MSNKSFPMSRRKLEDTLVVWDGVTSADGAASNDSLFDAQLIGHNDFISNMVVVLILDGPCLYEKKIATGFDNVTGEVYFDSFSAQILSGTPFRLINIPSPELLATIVSDVADILAAQYVPSADVTDNNYVRDVVGNKEDASVQVPSLENSVVAYTKGILDAVGDLTGDTLTTLGAKIGDGATDLVTDIAGIAGDIAAVQGDVTDIKTQTDKLAGASPSVGSTTEDWNAAEADVVSIGADDTKNKAHSLLVSIHNLVGTVITIRLYMQINGTERLVYSQAFDATTDPPGCWIVNGTVGIHEVLRCTLQSNAAADDGKAVHYDYMLEEM